MVVLRSRARCYFDPYELSPGGTFAVRGFDGRDYIATAIFFGYETGIACEMDGHAAWVQDDPFDPLSRSKRIAWIPEGSKSEGKTHDWVVRDGHWTRIA